MDKLMLASDYDQTFYINDADIIKNKTEVEKFRNIGNIFVIATGRSYLDFINKSKMYDIKYDYVILNHGATILDSKNNIISNFKINNDIVLKLKEDLNLDESISTFCCSLLDSRVEMEHKDLTKIHVKYNSREVAMKISDKLNSKYGDNITCYYVNNNSIEIISNEINKSKAILILSKKAEILKNNIYTIGDGYSDIEMVKDFNGACMKDCVKELLDVTNLKYNSISDFIKYIIKSNR